MGGKSHKVPVDEARAAAAKIITDALDARKERADANRYVRSTQLDSNLCAALLAWQEKHGVRSQSAAMRLLLEAALSQAGTLDIERRVAVARSGALRAAKVAVTEALDALSRGAE